MSNCLLQACNIKKTYGTVVKTEVLKGIDLSIQQGEFASLIGYSGSGKTTLLNILGALDKPTEGEVKFNGQKISAMQDEELAYFRNSNLGFIFQFHHLLPDFSVLENVLIPTWIKDGTANKNRIERAKELLEMVGLKDRINNNANDISGGQQQRVAIARALINEPSLILADEPTGNLDSDTTEQVYALMRDLNEKLQTSFLIVTHNDHIAAKSDRVIEIKDGNITKDFMTKEKEEGEIWQDLAPCYCKLKDERESVL